MINEYILLALFWLVGVPLSIALSIAYVACLIVITLVSLVMRGCAAGLGFIWRAPERAEVE